MLALHNIRNSDTTPRIGLEFAMRHMLFANATAFHSHVDALLALLGHGPFMHPLLHLQQY